MSEQLHRAGERWQLTFHRSYDNPPEQVWQAVTEPGLLGRWYPMTVDSLDLRPGGSIAFHDEEGNVVSAEVVEADPPRAFSFDEFDDETGDHRLDLLLEPDGTGCRFTFTHTFDSGAWAEQMEEGWEHCLAALGELLDELGTEPA